MTVIPDISVLMLSYQFGGTTNRDRYERWWLRHSTPTMLETIVSDMAPASTAIESGFQAYKDGETSAFTFTDFLNQTVSAYVGKQKFLDGALSAGAISELQHKKATALVTRHLTALVNNAKETLARDGVELSFSQLHRLQVHLPQGQMQEEGEVDVFAPTDAPVTGAEPAKFVPVMEVHGFNDDGVNIPNFVKIEILFPMLTEDVLLQFSRLYYSSGSATGTLDAIASWNSDALRNATRMFEDMKALRVTKTDFLELLTGANIAYAAQRKWFKHLLARKEVTKASFNGYIETVDATEQTLMDACNRLLSTLDLCLSFDENARLVIERKLAP